MRKIYYEDQYKKEFVAEVESIEKSIVNIM